MLLRAPPRLPDVVPPIGAQASWSPDAAGHAPRESHERGHQSIDSCTSTGANTHSPSDGSKRRQSPLDEPIPRPPSTVVAFLGSFCSSASSFSASSFDMVSKSDVRLVTSMLCWTAYAATANESTQ